MDGYASVGAAMIIGNMKITYGAHVPTTIIADTAVIKDAPIDMIKSGYGDIIGKYSALNDWKLSHVVNDEYICDYVYNLTMDNIYYDAAEGVIAQQNKLGWYAKDLKDRYSVLWMYYEILHK